MFMASMGDPAMATQAQQLIEAIEKFLDQAQSFQIGIAVTKAGIEIDGYVSAKPDTELAKTMADTPTTDKTLLVGLPAEPYMLALGVMSATTADQIKQSKAMVGSGYRARIRNHGHSCFLCEIVIRSQFHTTYEPEA
jgi:hypothetical protein